MKPFGHWGELTVPGIGSTSEALAAAKTLGITHILDVASEVEPFQVENPATGLKLVFEAANQKVYLVE